MFSRLRDLVPIWTALLLFVTVAGCGNPTAKTVPDPDQALKCSPRSTEDAARNDNCLVCRSLQVPLEVAGMRLTSFTTGEEALSQMNKCLGSDFTIQEVYIPCYKGVSGEIIFWIVELESIGEAETMLIQMEKHVQCSLDFEGYQHFADSTVDELHYGRYNGDGTIFVHHYFYRKGNRVYWVSMSGARQVSLLRRFLPLF